MRSETPEIMDQRFLSSRVFWSIVAGIAVFYVVFRVPIASRFSQTTDEVYYAIPGVMVHRTGIPSIPYIPARDADYLYYKSDICLFFFPPLYFFIQGAVHSLIGDGLAQARFASTLGAVGFLFLVAWFGKRAVQDSRVVLCSVFWVSLSNLVVWCGNLCRPDIYCAAFGLLALLLFLKDVEHPSAKFLWGAGLSLGCAVMCHVVGLIAWGMIGLLSLGFIVQKRRGFLRSVSLFAIGCLPFLMWLPYILKYPEIFRTQFITHMFGQGSSELSHSILYFPITVYRLYTVYYSEIFGWPLLLLLTVSACTFLYRHPPRIRALGSENSIDGRGRLCMLSTCLILSLFFHAFLVGRHYIFGYALFPLPFLVLVLAHQGFAVLDRFPSLRGNVIPTVILVLVLTVPFLRGSWLRVTFAHYQHWNDPAYIISQQVDRVVQDIPDGSRVAVGKTAVMPVYLEGYHTIYADPRWSPGYIGDYDYLLVGRWGREEILPLYAEEVRLVRSYGDRDDPFCVYLELYQRTRSGPEQ